MRHKTTGVMLLATIACSCALAYIGIGLSAIFACDQVWEDVLGSELASSAQPQQYFADGFLVTDGPTLCGLGRVTSLHCPNCGIDRLPTSETFFRCMGDSLQSVDLRDNSGITHLPANWSRLKALQNLTLANTKVANLPFSLCDNRQGDSTAILSEGLDLTGTPASKSMNWSGQVVMLGASQGEFFERTEQISKACRDAVNPTLESWYMALNNISDRGWNRVITKLVKDDFTSLRLLDARGNNITDLAL